MLTMLFWIVVIALVVGMLFGRYAKWIGILIALFGVGAFAFSFFYETYIKTTGDTSDVGMLCTILLVTCVPLGIVITIVGSFRSD